MKTIILGLILALFQHNVFAHEFVRTEGTQLRDPQGLPLKMRGVNLGGWLLWEGWLFFGTGGWISETQMQERIKQGVGEYRMQKFRKMIYDNFIQRDDILEISQMGYNSVRVPINHRLLTEDYPLGPYFEKDYGWKLLDQLVSWCKQYNVYIILDLHAAPGGQSPLFTADPEHGNLLWDNIDNEAKTVELWKKIAERYKNESIIAAYDLINEPSLFFPWRLTSLYSKIIKEIRKVDPHHMILLEGSELAQNLDIFTPYFMSRYDNIALSFHTYTFTGSEEEQIRVREEKLQSYVEVSNRLNVPIWNGEFGEIQYPILEATVEMLENPNYNVSGWSFWNWKKVSNAYPALMRIQTSSRWEEISAWLKSSDNASPPFGLWYELQNFAYQSRVSRLQKDLKLVEILNVD